MKIICKHQVISIIIAITCFSACTTNSNSQGILSYNLTEYPIFSISTPTKNITKIITDSAGNVYLLTVREPFLFLIDVKMDRIIRTLEIPHTLANFRQLSCADTAHFALLGEQGFVVYKNGVFYTKPIDSFHNNDVLLVHHPFIYNADADLIIAPFLAKNRTSEKEYPDLNVLKCYNIYNGASTEINYKYPSIYKRGRRGVPRLYLNTYRNKIIVSFSEDDSICIIDPIENTRQSFLCADTSVHLAKDLEQGLSKQEKLDAIQFKLEHNDEYGPAFYDGDKHTIRRIIKYGLPEKDDDSNYLGTLNSTAAIISRNTKKINQTIYRLPNAIYFVPSIWYQSPTDNTLWYKRIIPTNKKEGEWFFLLDNILLNSF